jgi:hypothetical protein
MKLKLSIIGLILLNIVFCTPSKCQNVTEINLEKLLKGKMPITSLNEIVKEITYIPLETNNECLFGSEIINVIIHDNKILVLDDKMCYVFNLQGKYITKFIQQGRGPFEAIQILDICYSSNYDRIYALDPRAKKMIVYNTDFKPQNEFSTDIAAHKMCPFNNMVAFANLSIDYDGSKLLFNITNSKGEIIKRVKDNRDPNWKIGMNFRSLILYEYNNKLIYKDKWCDTLYSISPSLNIMPYMVLKLGKYKNTPGYNDTSGLTRKPVSKNGLVDISRITELENYLYISLNGDYIVYNKNLKSASTFNVENNYGTWIGLTNDFDNGPNYYPQFKIDSNTIVRVVYPTEYEFNNSSFIKKHPWAEKVKIDDNPVLMIVKHK